MKQLGSYFLMFLFLFVGTGVTSASAFAADQAQAPLFKGLGDTHLDITTSNELAQRYFDQGLSFYYGFNHFEAIRSFKECLRLDPESAMCHMGVALSLGPNLNAPMDPKGVPEAQENIQKALALSHKMSAKERMYIESVAKRYLSKEELDRKELDMAYAKAMKRLAQAYPDDHHAQTLYAESLMVQHPWNFWTPDYKAQPWTPEILEILERTLKEEPHHLFANHLYIHAVEASLNAERGLPSARRLGKLAPGIGHLVHMPAHIYIRVGMYHEGSLANQAAIEADKAYQEQAKAYGLYTMGYMPHNYHFLWATATLEGREQLALEAARGTAERVHHEMLDVPGFGTLQHFLVIPLYGMVTFARWDDILKEPAPEGNRLYPRAVWHFARGMATVNMGEIEQAVQHLAFVQNAAEDERLKELTIWELNTTQDLTRIAASLLEAEILWARGDRERAIEMYKQAVAIEDTLNYDEPSSWGTPTRWYLGDALLKMDRFMEAEKVYRDNLVEYPKNGWALKGLHLALMGQGKVKEASAVQAEFEVAWKAADVELKSSRLEK